MVYGSVSISIKDFPTTTARCLWVSFKLQNRVRDELPLTNILPYIAAAALMGVVEAMPGYLQSQLCYPGLRLQ